MAKRAESQRGERSPLKGQMDMLEEADKSRTRKVPAEDYDDFRELEEALRIDEHALEEALRDQPTMFYRVSSAYALEISRRDAAKQALQDAEAEEDLAFRKEAQDEERKITEGEVRATVQTAPKVVAARDQLNKRSESMGKLGALKEAFQQRSYALKSLCELYVANYFSGTEQSGAERTVAADRNRQEMSKVRRAGS